MFSAGLLNWYCVDSNLLPCSGQDPATLDTCPMTMPESDALAACHKAQSDAKPYENEAPEVKAKAR